jgi:hypothetical protein
MTVSYPSSRCRQRSCSAADTPGAATTASAQGGSVLQLIDGLLQQLDQLRLLLGGEISPLHHGAWEQASPADCQGPDDSQAGGFQADGSQVDGSWPDDSRADGPWESGAWDELSVVELRSLLRCHPIDRRSLPAPIELLRRDELLTALQQLHPLPH